MEEMINTLKLLIETINDLKSTTEQIKTLKNITDDLIKFILETEIDYKLQSGKKKNIKQNIEDIRERIKLFHHSVLQIHASEKSQQGLMKTNIIQGIVKIQGLLRKIEIYLSEK